jgi:hypothetical protein
MTIVEWKDEDFMTAEQYNYSQKSWAKRNPAKRLGQEHHNMRQNTFLRQCAIYLKVNANI